MLHRFHEIVKQQYSVYRCTGIAAFNVHASYLNKNIANTILGMAEWNL